MRTNFSKINVIAILVLCISSLTLGQTNSIDPKTLTQKMLQEGVATQQQTGGVKALEKAIDPKSYILGPGDVLQFKVWGGIEQQFNISVNPTGNVSLPAIGELFVDGLTLHQADSLVKEFAVDYYRNSEVNLDLISLRERKVSISGAILATGLFRVGSQDRLSDLIAMSGGLLLEEEIEEVEITPTRGKSTQKETDKPFWEDTGEKQALVRSSLRHIQIIDKTGNARTVDYQQYLRLGDIEFNPVLNDGDRVYVPYREKKVGVVNLFGAVKIAGEYEFKDGDTVIDIVKLAGGFRTDADSSGITVVRYSTTSNSTQSYTVDFQKNLNIDLKLSVDDRIFVRRIQNYKPKLTVLITGEVNYPGYYPIEENVTTLSQLVTKAGGFTDRANLVMSKVSRNAPELTQDSEYERLKLMNVSEMSTMEYEYYKTRSRIEAPLVIADFVKLFKYGDENADVLLRDLDEIHIPTVSPVVQVIGQVNNSGLIRFQEGETLEHYINLAGGYSWNARKSKIRLIKAQTGQWVKPKSSTIIDIGDTIFIPEKQEIDYWELWKDMLLVVSQIATIVLVIQSTSK